MSLNIPLISRSNPGVMGRPVGRLGLAILTLSIAAAPAILFFDPIDIWPGLAAHRTRCDRHLSALE